MSFSQLFARGIRRLTDRRTYIVLLIGWAVLIFASIVCKALVDNDFDSGVVIGPAFGALIGWPAMTFIWGGFHLSAVERPELSRPGALIQATLRKLGTFLGVTLILAGVTVIGGLIVSLLLLPARGGPNMLPLLAMLTPLALLLSGLGLLALVTMMRLAFAAAACDSITASEAVTRAWQLFRRRASDTLLWLAADGAILLGLGVLVIGPVVVGSYIVLGAEVVLFAVGSFFDFLTNTPTNAGAAKVGFYLQSLVISTFFVMVLGAVASHAAGSSVAFYRSTSKGGGPGLPKEAAVRSFCDHCGAPRDDEEAGYCDSCGSALVVA